MILTHAHCMRVDQDCATFPLATKLLKFEAFKGTMQCIASFRTCQLHDAEGSREASQKSIRAHEKRHQHCLHLVQQLITTAAATAPDKTITTAPPTPTTSITHGNHS